MKPFLALTPEDVRALEDARRRPPPPIDAILKLSRQLAPTVWDAVSRRPLPRGGFSLRTVPRSPKQRVAPFVLDDFVSALGKRHLADLTFSEVRKGVQALSSLYVERRGKLSSGAALNGAGKRAAFALFYGPLHLLTVREIAKSVGATRIAPPLLVDLGCGTLTSGAGWALAAREAGHGVELLGVEWNGWAAGEARLTLGALGLRGRILKEDCAAFRPPPKAGAILAAFTVNELDDLARGKLLARLLEAAEKGAQLLIVEPLAKRSLTWWDDWEQAFRKHGGRADEWRFRLELPETLRLMDKAAGLDHRELGARSLYLAGVP